MEKISAPVKQELLLEAGVHIGTKIRTSDMEEFVFKRRDDGLYILDLRKTAERLLDAAKLIGKYQPEDVLIVASRIYSSGPASKLSALTGIQVIKGRFVPGTMTNLTSKNFREPKLVFVCDPKSERAAISESAKNGVPVIALCDTDNETRYIDLVVPVNNKGRRSLALVFYILSRELMLSQGKISSYDEFQHDLGYFEKMFEKEEEIKPPEEAKEEPEEKKEEEPKEVPKEEPKEKEKEEKKTRKKKTAKKEEKSKEKKEEKPKAEEKSKEKQEGKKPAKKEEKSAGPKKKEEKQEEKKPVEKAKEDKEGESKKEEKPKEEKKEEKK